MFIYYSKKQIILKHQKKNSFIKCDYEEYIKEFVPSKNDE